MNRRSPARGRAGLLAALALATAQLALVQLATSRGAAAATGVLVKDEPGLSQDGRLVWNCTYIVGTQETTLTLDERCPPTHDVP